MFTLGSLYLQDIKKAKLRSYKETREHWSVVHTQYADYLTFEPTEITTDADSERLQRLSEVVGIALGMATMVVEFNVNQNRFNKFMAPCSVNNRVDYEYYSGANATFTRRRGRPVNKPRLICAAIFDQKEAGFSELRCEPTAGWE